MPQKLTIALYRAAGSVARNAEPFSFDRFQLCQAVPVKCAVSALDVLSRGLKHK
jgi:hypothetical protein